MNLINLLTLYPDISIVVNSLTFLSSFNKNARKNFDRARNKNENKKAPAKPGLIGYFSYFQSGLGYHLIAALAQVKPLPKEARTIISPS
jgi:hypothetical protein